MTLNVGDRVRIVGARSFRGETGIVIETSPKAILVNPGQYYKVALDNSSRTPIFHTDNIRPAAKKGKYTSSQYLSYETGRDLGVFGRNNPVDTNLPETWYMVGWLQQRGSTAFSPEKKSGELNKDGTVREVGGGATRHILFPDPKSPGLDAQLKVYFDESEIPGTGRISINSKAWYEFIADQDGVIYSSHVVPDRFRFYYELGLAGKPFALEVKVSNPPMSQAPMSREESDAMTQDCGFTSVIGTATFNRG